MLMEVTKNGLAILDPNCSFRVVFPCPANFCESHSTMAFDSKVDRMHVPKLIALEEVGWYRENSLRFYKLFRPKPLLSGFVSMVLIPVFIVNLCVVSKVHTFPSPSDIVGSRTP